MTKDWISIPGTCNPYRFFERLRRFPSVATCPSDSMRFQALEKCGSTSGVGWLASETWETGAVSCGDGPKKFKNKVPTRWAASRYGAIIPVNGTKNIQHGYLVLFKRNRVYPLSYSKLPFFVSLYFKHLQIFPGSSNARLSFAGTDAEPRCTTGIWWPGRNNEPNETTNNPKDIRFDPRIQQNNLHPRKLTHVP